MNVRFQLMLPEEDHGELHRLAGETRMAAADLMRLGLCWVLANRDVLQRLPVQLGDISCDAPGFVPS